MVTSDLRISLWGIIAAGMPLEVFAEVDLEKIPEDLQGSCSTIFRVRGEGCIGGYHFSDGDLVIVRPPSRLREGDVVAARIRRGSIVLGLYRRDGSRICVSPARGKAIEGTEDEIELQGAVVGMMRTVD